MKRISASFLPPIALDSRRKIPLYSQLYEWFRRAILDRTTRAVDEKPRGGTEGIAYTGFERVRTIAGGGLPRDVCWRRHVCGQVDPGRRIKASTRESTGCLAGSIQRPSSPPGFTPRGIDARAGANLVKQTGCIPSEPAGTRAFSKRSMVQAGKSSFAKTYKTVNGLWRRDGIYAAS